MQYLPAVLWCIGTSDNFSTGLEVVPHGVKEFALDALARQQPVKVRTRYSASQYGDFQLDL